MHRDYTDREIPIYDLYIHLFQTSMFFNQEMMKALLHDLGLESHIVNDGEECVKKTSELNPDLILMDINMPKMDGITATREIRQHSEYADVPIVALSADAFTEQQKAVCEAGFSDFLTKPLDLGKLTSALAKYLKTS